MQRPQPLAALVLMAVALAVLAACSGGPGPGGTVTPAATAPAAATSAAATPTAGASPTRGATPAAATATPATAASLPELKYRLIANFSGVFFCDPDFYPVARVGQEEKNAQEQFGGIRADGAEFSAVLRQLRLPDQADYPVEQKVLIYREHKKLKFGVEMAPSGDGYRFTLRIGQGQGERIEGTVTASGRIAVEKRQPSFNTCPICLAKGTIIDTPDGPVPVEQIRDGMAVWTADESGRRMAAPVVRTAVTRVPASFLVVRVRLSDGRTVTASPGHPTAEGRALGDYATGDILDGAVVAGVDRVAYDSGATFDLLPAGPTGLYWADGILLKSTLAQTR